MTATAKDSSTITLTWVDNSDNETYFRIDRSSDGLNFTEIATVPANATSYTDLGLAANTTYTYRAKAYNDVGSSYWCDNAVATTPAAAPASTTPAAPSNVVATAPSATQVTLTWNDNSDNETGFNIERQTGSGAFTLIASVGAGVTSYSDTSVAPSTQYTYRVIATNEVGDSGYATSSAVTTPAQVTAPAAPSNVNATAITSNKVEVTWTDNSDDETGFAIDQSTSGGSFTQIGTVSAQHDELLCCWPDSWDSVQLSSAGI